MPGWLLNQFSMSEHNGDLRVATTDSTNWGWGGGGDIDFVVKVGDVDVIQENIATTPPNSGPLWEVTFCTGCRCIWDVCLMNVR